MSVAIEILAIVTVLSGGCVVLGCLASGLARIAGRDSEGQS